MMLGGGFSVVASDSASVDSHPESARETNNKKTTEEHSRIENINNSESINSNNSNRGVSTES